MHGHIAHFAFNADDLPASRRFYESLFGWTFENPYPGFLRTFDAGPIGALQARRSLLEAPTNGPECTFAVDDLDAAVARAVACGGVVVMPPAPIPGAGTLAFVTDPGGNVVGLMRFD
jgi:predicted enzyme related to lactoylglutathione lyase